MFTGKVEQALATSTGDQTAAAQAVTEKTAALSEAQAMRATTAAETEREAKAQELAAKTKLLDDA